MTYTLRVFRKPIQGKQMELEKKLLEFRKLLGVQGNGALTRGYLNINGPVTHMLQFETLSEIQDYFSRSSEHSEKIIEMNELSHNFTNVISERIKQPKSPLSRGDAKFMMQFWFTAKFGKRAELAKTLIQNDLVEGAVNSMIGSFPAGDIVVSNAMKNLDEIPGILEMGEKYSGLMKQLEPIVSSSSRHLSMLVFD